MLAILIRQRGDLSVIDIIQSSAHQRKTLCGKIVNRWRKIKLPDEPRLDGVLIGRADVGEMLGHQRAHVSVLGGLTLSRSFSGNIGGPDKQNAPNINSDVKTGIGSWSIADIEQLLKTGITPETDSIGSGMKAVVQGTSKLTDADRHAMAVYLKSIPPIHVDLPPPKLAFQSK